MARPARTFLLPVFLLACSALPLAAQRRTPPPDTLSRTSEAYQAARRAWLEARRQGMAGERPVYGSAVVQATPDGAVGIMADRGLDGRRHPDCADQWGRGRDRDDRESCGPEWRYGRQMDDWTGWGGWRSRGPAGPFGYQGGWGGYPGGWFGAYPGAGGPFSYGYGGFGYPGRGWRGNGAWGWPPVPRSGLGGATEYELGPWGYGPMYPFGWSAPGGGYAFPWPGVPGGECARVMVTTGGGLRHTIDVAPRVFGLSRVSDLDLVIDERLSRGVPVVLHGLDGRVVRLDPGPDVADVRVFPCDAS